MAEKKNVVGWFEIPVKDLKRAKAFYEGVFGQKLDLNEMDKMTMAWWPMVMKGVGSSGTLVKAPGYKPSKSGTIVYFMVTDINATLKKVAKKGGKTLIPRTNIGEWGFFAHFEDTEGNRIAIHSMK